MMNDGGDDGGRIGPSMFASFSAVVAAAVFNSEMSASVISVRGS
jgi:hypothetical protein